jgi:hypothetical protein
MPITGRSLLLFALIDQCRGDSEHKEKSFGV